jgi:CubicO group peptidase (beta-lactamase class C family)
VSTYLHELAGSISKPPAGLGTTYALMVVQHGEVIIEHYNGVLPMSERPVTAQVPLLSWSMAKSVTQSALGLAHDDGLLDVDAATGIAEWANDDRHHITVRHLLQMTSGLEWNEDYVDGTSSDVIEMLFGGGAADVAGFARNKPLVATPGTTWNYSSGTTNILTCLLKERLAICGTTMYTYLRDRLFAPIGATVTEEQFKFDAAGTWIGSSFLHLTSRDWARYGELYLNNGCVNGKRVLGQRWVDEAKTQGSLVGGSPLGDQYGYSNHWWLWPSNSATPDAFSAFGYEAQHVIVVPSKNAVVVRLGQTPDAEKLLLRSLLHRLIEALPN